MKSHLRWQEGFKSIVDNGRGHEVALDMPPEKNGSDQGATALELSAMSLNGCIGTIFAVVASKSGVEFSDLEVEMDAQKTEADRTFTSVTATVHVTTREDGNKVQQVLDKTMKNCPVGLLFMDADIPVDVTLQIHNPDFVQF